MKKIYAIAASVLFFFAANASNAALTLNQNNAVVPNFDFSGIFKGLSLPSGIDFTKKNAGQIHQDISGMPFQKYKTDIARFASGFGQNNFLRDIYSFFIGIVRFIGSAVVWILEFLLVIVRRGLSFISYTIS